MAKASHSERLLLDGLNDWRAQYHELAGRPVLADPYRPGRAMVAAQHGMVAAAHPLASLAGLDALRAGGGAVDAAVSAAAVLAVAEPAMTGLGGDVFLLYYDAAERRVHGLNGSGRSPRALGRDQLAVENGAIASESWSAVTVPGAVDAWVSAHRRFGRRPWAELLAPAIDYAREGFPVSPIVAESWRDHAEVLRRDARRVFLPGGEIPRAGQRFANRELARSLAEIAEGGRDAFYDGPIAAEIVACSRAGGGWLAREDFAEHRSDWVEPLGTGYRGYRCHQIPPNGQGLAVLLMLNILDGFALDELSLNGAEYLHLLIEAKKLAYADAHRFVCDPAFADIPLAELLSRGHAERQRARIDPQRAAPAVSAALPGSDTTLLVAADAAGNAVSLINSLFHPFGSGIVGGRTGILLQNRGCGFSLDPEHPNAFAPNKRPFHTIIPGMVTRDDHLYLSYGLMGGPMQPQGHAQLLLGHIAHGQPLQAAIDMPRWQHISGLDVLLEHGTREVVAEGLASRGHRPILSDHRLFGGAQAIARDQECAVYFGASDPRKDGCALGY